MKNQFARVCTLAGVLALSGSLFAQGGARPGQRRGRDNAANDPTAPTAESLLKLAHDQAQEMSAIDRATLLSRAISTAQRIQPDFVDPWTEELFGLVTQLPEEKRLPLELGPVMAVANDDAEEALDLIEKMDAPTSDSLRTNFDPRVSVASIAFTRYWNMREGRRRNLSESEDAKLQLEKLDRMRSIASKLGRNGVYPYGSFSAPLMTYKVKDPAAHDALFAELMNAFRGGNGSYADISEFTRMLMLERGSATASAYREALTMAVSAIDRLPTDQLPDMTFSIRGQTTSASLDNAASMLIMRIVPMLKQIDPEWAQQVLDKHQDVAKFEQSRNAPGTIITTSPPGTGTAASSTRSPQRQLGPVRAAGQNSSDAAKVFAQQITDPSARAAANAEIAASLANEDAAEAATYMAQASQALSTIDDPAGQLMVVTSLARAAYASGDNAAAATYSQRGFALGDEVVRADYDANPDKQVMSLKGVSDLSTLVTTSMRSDPHGTVARIGNVRYPLLRTNLLLTAAEAADNGRGPRGGFRGGAGSAIRPPNLDETLQDSPIAATVTSPAGRGPAPGSSPVNPPAKPPE